MEVLCHVGEHSSRGEAGEVPGTEEWRPSSCNESLEQRGKDPGKASIMELEKSKTQRSRRKSGEDDVEGKGKRKGLQGLAPCIRKQRRAEQE